jgi:AcrR family transcriptional regulator
MAHNAGILDTKQRILNAAEKLFAEHGLAATSLRAITAEAGVNLASVNYHFHSKEELIRALYTRRLEPITHRRLAMLDAAEREAGSKPAALARIVDALVGPVLEAKAANDDGGLPVLLGRFYAEPGGLAGEIIREQMSEVARRFGAALHRALPKLPRSELAWRMHFIIGALAHTMVAGRLLEFISGGECNSRDVEGARQRLTAFALAGLNAPITKTAGSPRRKPPKSKHAGESACATLVPQELAGAGGAGIQPARLVPRAAKPVRSVKS